MLSLVIIAIALALAQCQSGQFSCFNGPPDGFYCTNDLVGYHDCRQVAFPVENPPKYCPSGTKCSCFINTKCEVPETEICQPIQTLPTLSEDFDYTFTFEGNSSQGAWLQTFDQIKRVIRNTEAKKLRERTWDLKTLDQHFQVILPISGGKFEEYTGSYPPSSLCNKYIIDTFPDFWPDLSKFYLVKTQGEIQVWESRIGRRNLGEDAFRTILELQVTGGVVIPLRYESYRSGGNNSKFSFTKIRKLRTFEAVKRSSVFFQKPAICL